MPRFSVINLHRNFISVTEIFIACASHCKDCEDAVLSVATYLNMTSHCKCFLDLCSLPKEWSSSMAEYFENQIAKCQKVVVLFTVSGSIETEDDVRGKKKLAQCGKHFCAYTITADKYGLHHMPEWLGEIKMMKTK